MVGVKYEGSWFLPGPSARYLKSGVFLTSKGLHMCIARNIRRRFGRDAIGLFDARSLLDIGLESRRVHLMYLSHGTVPFGFLMILQFRCFDLLSQRK